MGCWQSQFVDYSVPGAGHSSCGNKTRDCTRRCATAACGVGKASIVGNTHTKPWFLRHESSLSLFLIE